jgi:hypothetical protein
MPPPSQSLISASDPYWRRTSVNLHDNNPRRVDAEEDTAQVDPPVGPPNGGHPVTRASPPRKPLTAPPTHKTTPVAGKLNVSYISQKTTGKANKTLRREISTCLAKTMFFMVSFAAFMEATLGLSVASLRKFATDLEFKTTEEGKSVENEDATQQCSAFVEAIHNVVRKGENAVTDALVSTNTYQVSSIPMHCRRSQL